MTFNFTNPGYYLWFIPVTMFIVFATGILRRRVDRQLSALLVMSYLFFVLASGWHLVLLITSTTVDWFAGKRIFESQNGRKRKIWLIYSISVNLGLLFVFKYLDFIIRSLGWASLKFGGQFHIDEFGLLLPVGISFYTFQTMSYTIDIFRRRQKPADSFVQFACYASFFPQLVAGPILRFSEFESQVRDPLEPKFIRIKIGITLIIYGLVKKMVFADNFGVHVDGIFSEGIPLENVILVYWGALLFGLQIYCDFSGYTDIALGSAHLFGIQLPENFRAPYRSRSPQEFWRRWHITLSTWLRDYLYITLGGSKHGRNRMFAALMITMILGGLWHGASWNFALWGLIHGVLLVAHRLISKSSLLGYFRREWPKLHFISSLILTQWMIFFTWLIFRIEDSNMLFRSMKTYFLIDSSFDVSVAFNSMPGQNTLIGLLLLSFLSFHLCSSMINGSLKYQISGMTSGRWGVVVGIMIAMLILLRPAEAIEFIYFRF